MGAQVVRRRWLVEIALLLLCGLGLPALLAPRTSAAECSPRPRVSVQTTAGQTGRLTASIQVTTDQNTPNNRIVELRFGTPRPSSNAVVDIVNGPQGVANGDVWTPPPGTVSATLQVRPARTGESATVHLTVVDVCGAWPTFVGGGAGTFGPVPKSTVATVGLSTTNFVARDRVSVSWAGVTSPATQDWFGLYRSSDPDDRNNLMPDKQVFTGGLEQGTTVFELPAGLTAGTYDLRLFRAKTLTRLAVSPTFTVVAENPVQTKATDLTQLTTAPPKSAAFVAGDSAFVAADSVPRAVSATNDNIAAALSVDTLPASRAVNTASATQESGEPTTCSGATVGKTVWYVLRPTTTFPMVIDTNGSNFDTVLAVYSGGPAFGTLGLVGCNDDASGVQSRVAFTAQAGLTYHVQVGGYAGRSGDLVVNFARTAPLTNDNFGGRTVVSGTTAQFTVLTDLATVESGEATTCDYAPLRKTVWYEYTPGTTTVTIDTFGSDFDTVLAVYRGTTLSNLGVLACNDDTLVSGNTLQSRVSFIGEAGAKYFVQVGGYGGAAGSLTVRFSVTAIPGNDTFAGRKGVTLPTRELEITDRASTETGEFVNLTCDDVSVSLGKSVWYTFTPGAGSVTIDTFGSSFDTVLAAYRGSSLSDLVLLDCNDNTNGTASLVSFTAAASTTYFLQVGGRSTGSPASAESGSLVVNFARTPNNNFASATRILAAPTRFEQVTGDATTESGEPALCGSASIGKTLWYSLTTLVDVDLAIDTNGSNFDTVLAIYTGTSLGTLTQRVCNDDSSGTASSVTFIATAGTTYYVQVGGFSGASGRLALNITLPPPSNDHYSSARAVTVLPQTFFAATAGATIQPPTEVTTCNSAPYGNTVWYSFTNIADTPMAVTTRGSDFDTVLAVFEYDVAANTLNPIVCNDDDASSLGVHSLVSFTAIAGRQYRIQVGGYGTAPFISAGNLFVTFFPLAPSNDLFPGATAFVGGQARAFTGGATLQTGEPTAPACPSASVPIGRSVWYSLTPGARTVTIDTVGSNFDTVIAVYRGDTLAALTPVTCNDDTGGTLLSQVTLTAQAGVTYRVQISGFAGRAGTLIANFR